MKEAVKLLMASILFFTYFLGLPANSDQVSINEKQILKNAPTMNPKALEYAIKAYNWAEDKKNITKKNILTLVDFSKSSSKKRLWVINLKSSKVLMNTYTTHGKNSGLSKASSFSNKNNTKKSSVGVFEILNSYHGSHGLSMRVSGLEKGINDNAFKRNIVIHPASYASAAFVKQHNRAGRSWGCFAIDPKLSHDFIKMTKDGSVLYAYSKQSKSDPNFV